MNTKNIKAKFGRPTRFEVKPAVAPFRVTQDTELERLKARLLLQLLQANEDPELNAPLRRAANEAAALAWTTQFPLLFFPTLLEEKTRHEQRRVKKQREIFQRTKKLFNARWQGAAHSHNKQRQAAEAKTCEMTICE